MHTKNRMLAVAAFALAGAACLSSMVPATAATAATVATVATAAEPMIATESPAAADGESTAAPTDERIFIGRATLTFWQSVALPEFKCPGYAPWVNVTKKHNANMPKGIEAGSGDIRGHVDWTTYRRHGGESVAGWNAFWANSITNWNVGTQEVSIYVHCTSDINKAWSFL